MPQVQVDEDDDEIDDDEDDDDDEPRVKTKKLKQSALAGILCSMLPQLEEPKKTFIDILKYDFVPSEEHILSLAQVNAWWPRRESEDMLSLMCAGMHTREPLY